MNIQLAPSIDSLPGNIQYKHHYLNILGEVVVIVDVCSDNGEHAEKAVIVESGEYRRQIKEF
jgi:hypothetical protein